VFLPQTHYHLAICGSVDCGPLSYRLNCDRIVVFYDVDITTHLVDNDLELEK
jgi:hypothetical protein